MIVLCIIQIILHRPYSTSGVGERGSWRDPRRDGKRKLAAFASVVEEQVPKDSEVDLCLRQF